MTTWFIYLNATGDKVDMSVCYLDETDDKTYLGQVELDQDQIEDAFLIFQNICDATSNAVYRKLMGTNPLYNKNKSELN